MSVVLIKNDDDDHVTLLTATKLQLRHIIWHRTNLYYTSLLYL